MAVAHDASAESHTSTTGSTSQASFTWTHTLAAGAKGIGVMVWTNANEDDIVSVLCGTSGLSWIDRATDTAGEPGRCDLYFLGIATPTGAQTMTVNRVNNATTMYAVSFSVTAATNTEIHRPGIVKLEGDNTVAEQSVTDGSPGTNSVRYAGGHFGHQTPPTTGASSTAMQSIDIGATCFVSVSETTAGQGARNVGMSSGTSDDRAALHFAVREMPAAVTPNSKVPWQGVICPPYVAR